MSEASRPKTVIESNQAVNLVIQSMMNSVNQKIHEKKLGKKLAPLISVKFTSFAFQSFASMQSKNIQLSDTLSTINNHNTIKKDSLSVNKILRKNTGIRQINQRISQQIPKQGNKRIKKKDSMCIKNQSNIFQNSHTLKNKSIAFLKEQSFEKLNEIEYAPDLGKEEEVTYEAIKSKKFFLDGEQAAIRQIKKDQDKQKQQIYDKKLKQLKKYENRFSFDYNGQTIEAKNPFIEKPLSINKLTLGFDEQLQSKNLPQKLKYIQKRNSNKLAKIKMLSQDQQKQIKQNAEINKIFSKGIDPLEHLTADNLSEGVRIQNKASNICKQKFRKRIQTRLKTLNQFKKTILHDNFKQFSIKSLKDQIMTNKQRAKTITQQQLSRPDKASNLNRFETIQNDQMIMLKRKTETLKVKHHQKHKQNGFGKGKKRIKSEYHSIENSRGLAQQRSILNSTWKSKASSKHGRINIDNTYLFEQICSNDNQALKV